MRKKIILFTIFALVFFPIFNVEAIKVEGISTVSCGNIEKFPEKIPQITSMLVTIIEVAVPVLLVLMGSIDLFKGLISQKDDEIKKGQQRFLKRLIAGALIFFVIAIVKLFVSIVADNTAENNNMTECIDCFLSGTSNCRKP